MQEVRYSARNISRHTLEFFYGIYDFEISGKDAFRDNRQRQYNKMCEGMVEELCKKYGEIAIMWFDGGAHGPDQGGPDVQGIFEKHQPNGIFYHNLDLGRYPMGGSESGTVPYPCWGTYHTTSWFENRGNDEDFRPLKYGDPEGQYFCPAMSDAPLRGSNGGHQWFWEPNGREIYLLAGRINAHVLQQCWS